MNTAPYFVRPVWRGETVAILASGPSMCNAVAQSVRGRCRVIAINNQALDLAPWADVLYAPDHKWWDVYGPQAMRFEALKLTLRRTYQHDVQWLEQSGATAIDDRPFALVHGGNAGYQAVQLAAHFGARRVLLLGFDMRDVDGKRRRQTYPRELDARQRYALWLSHFERLAPHMRARGVDVVNCTPNSALLCFRFSTVDAELAQEVACA